MKHLTWLLPLAALLGARPPQAAHVNPCDVFGVIYLEKTPYLANFRVYVETEADYRADLIVFRETNQLFADKQGYWFLTDKRGFANYTVAIVQDRSVADFVIYYTDKENWAGCNRR
jgi:hypothetical protein